MADAHSRLIKVSWDDGGGVTTQDTKNIIQRHLNNLMKELVAAGVKAPSIFAHGVDADKPGDGMPWDAVEGHDPPDPPWATHV